MKNAGQLVHVGLKYRRRGANFVERSATQNSKLTCHTVWRARPSNCLNRFLQLRVLCIKRGVLCYALRGWASFIKWERTFEIGLIILRHNVTQTLELGAWATVTKQLSLVLSLSTETTSPLWYPARPLKLNYATCQHEQRSENREEFWIAGLLDS